MIARHRQKIFSLSWNNFSQATLKKNKQASFFPKTSFFFFSTKILTKRSVLKNLMFLKNRYVLTKTLPKYKKQLCGSIENVEVIVSAIGFNKLS